MDPNPLQQFRTWLDQAVATRLPLPEAMALATATPDGQPSVRLVLLRGLDERGFVFFTNYDSRKARELDANPRAALVFYWAELERQIRIEGPVEKVSGPAADAYFQSRPRGSQLGAWASPQSQVIPGRQWLEQRMQAVTDQFADSTVPRPPHWGGYRVLPLRLEFWQGKPNRLHDRWCYTRQENGLWLMQCLAP